VVKQQLAQALNEHLRVQGRGGFYVVLVRSQGAGFVPVGLQIRAGEDQHRDVIEIRPSLQPGKDGEPIQPGHFDVHQEQGGQRVKAAIRIRLITIQIIDDPLAVAYDAERVGKRGRFESQLHEEDIVGRILREEDGAPFDC